MKLFDPKTNQIIRANIDPPTLNARSGAILLEQWRDVFSASDPVRHDWQSVNVFGFLVSLQGDQIHKAFHHPEELFETSHWQACWAQYGCPVFNLSHGLTSAMLLTDCRGLRMEDVQWPFESVLIALPTPGSPFKFHPVNDTHPVEGRWIRVHRYQAPLTRDERVRIEHEFERARTEARKAQNPIQSYVQALRQIQCPTGSRTIIHVDDVDGNSVFQADKWYHEGPVEPWLECRQPDGHVSEFSDLDRFAVQAAARLVVNLFVYINTQVKERKLDLTIRAPKRDREGNLRPYTWQVGGEIKLPKEMHGAASAFAQRHTDKASWRIHSRFAVRGHYHRYWIGSKKDPNRQRRMQWVAPYWKGPADGPQISSRLYAVDTPDDKPVHGSAP